MGLLSMSLIQSSFISSSVSHQIIESIQSFSVNTTPAEALSPLTGLAASLATWALCPLRAGTSSHFWSLAQCLAHRNGSINAECSAFRALLPRVSPVHLCWMESPYNRSSLILTLFFSAQGFFPKVCSENTTPEDALGGCGHISTGYTVSPHLALLIGSAA